MRLFRAGSKHWASILAVKAAHPPSAQRDTTPPIVVDARGAPLARLTRLLARQAAAEYVAELRERGEVV